MIERILELMETTHTTAAMLTREISLTNGLVTQWKQGKQKPSLEAVSKLAQYFNVSTDYLIFGKESSISPNQQELLELYSQLDERGQGEVLGFIKAKIKS